MYFVKRASLAISLTKFSTCVLNEFLYLLYNTPICETDTGEEFKIVYPQLIFK